jgi:hypothetical protein
MMESKFEIGGRAGSADEHPDDKVTHIFQDVLQSTRTLNLNSQSVPSRTESIIHDKSLVALAEGEAVTFSPLIEDRFAVERNERLSSNWNKLIGGSYDWKNSQAFKGACNDYDVSINSSSGRDQARLICEYGIFLYQAGKNLSDPSLKIQGERKIRSAASSRDAEDDALILGAHSQLLRKHDINPATAEAEAFAERGIEQFKRDGNINITEGLFTMGCILNREGATKYIEDAKCNMTGRERELISACLNRSKARAFELERKARQ